MLSRLKDSTNPPARALLRGILILALMGAVFSTAQAHEALKKELPTELTVEYIAEKLATEFQNVVDLSAQVAFVQVSPRNGARSEGEMQLKAVFPGLVRAAWTNPDLLRGLVWIVDTQNDRFTQYEPTTGEAHHHSLSDTLSDYPLLPLTPDQLFALPSDEQFELEVAEKSGDDDENFVMVRAVDKQTGAEYRVWVDLTDWVVKRVESLSPAGTVELSAWIREFHVNLGLTATDIRALPPGTIERSLY